MRASLRRARLVAVIAVATALPLTSLPAASAVAPATPPDCAGSLGTFSQTTPAPWPGGAPRTVTSTIVVSGVTGKLFDVDVTTDVRHNTPSVLDATLTSPAGTTVTLTSNNGGTENNVFRGTVWDDGAGKTAVDYVYAQGTIATPLAPEEPLGAFIGEDPNGIWTMTVADQTGASGGGLESWSMALASTGTLGLTPAGAGSPSGIPAAVTNGSSVTSTIVVTGAGTIGDVDLSTSIAHTNAADLDVTLTSPTGTVVTLTTDNGGVNDDVFAGTVWNDGANPGGVAPYVTNNGVVTDHLYANLTLASPLTPEEPLAALIGESAAGTWTLTFTDDTALNNGTLTGWSLDITTAACRTDLATSITDTPDPAFVNGSLTYDVTVANTGGSEAVDTAVAVDLPSDVAFVSATPSTGGACGGVSAGATGTLTCSWTAPTLVGASRTVAVVVTPTATGTPSVTATASSTTPDTDASDDADTATTTVESVDLVTSVADAPDPALVNGSLAYSLTIDNAGTAAATGVAVSVPLPATVDYVSASGSNGVDCSGVAVGATGTLDCTWPASVASGGTETLDIVVTPTATGPLSATATASSSLPEAVPADNAATAGTTVQSVDLVATIAGSPDPAFVSGSLTYDVTIDNTGTAAATGVAVSVPLPGTVGFVSATPSDDGACSVPAVGAFGTVDCSWPTEVAAAATRTVQIVVTPTVAGALSATATATTTATEAAATDNVATAGTTVVSVDLVTVITDTPDPLVVGGSLTYGVSIASTGTAGAAGVSVSVPLPAGVAFVSATPSVDGSCTVPAVGASGTVACSWSTATVPASSRTVQIVVTAPAVGTLSATATAATTSTEADLTDNVASASTTVNAAAAPPSDGSTPPAGGGTTPTTEDGRICTVVGTAGPDVLVGTPGVDSICGLGGNDVLTGGAGDFVDGGADNDQITLTAAAVGWGGLGDDRLTGSSGNDKLTGGAGTDVLTGLGGADRLAGGLGNDRATGGTGNDILTGGAGDDRMNGGAGNDRVTAGAGADILTGGAGADIVVGGSGNDRMDGGAGADRLAGEAGADTLLGGAGNDRLAGGEGADRLTGGLGLDSVNGGAGIDTSFGVGDIITFVEIRR